MKHPRFAFTKLVLSDLDGAERFYRTVFGMSVVDRVRADDHALALEETVLASPDEPGGNVLILTRYLHRPAPAPGAAWVGFLVDDVDATVERAIQLGSRCVVPAHENEEHATRAAILEDNEGHLIEVVQFTGDR